MGVPPKWLVYHGKSHRSTWMMGVPPWPLVNLHWSKSIFADEHSPLRRLPRSLPPLHLVTAESQVMKLVAQLFKVISSGVLTRKRMHFPDQIRSDHSTIFMGEGMRPSIFWRYSQFEPALDVHAFCTRMIKNVHVQYQFVKSTVVDPARSISPD